MTYYLLATCILSLVFVYVIYLTGKNVPDKVNYPIVFTPSILSGIILLFSFTVTTPIDTRKAEYTAQSIKHYPEWIEEIEVNDTSSVRIKHREYYTMFYKTTTGTGEFEIPRWTYNYFSELWDKEVCTSLDDRVVYITEWDKDPKTALIYTKPENFINYFKTSMSLYNFYHISDKTAKEEKLFIRERLDIINSDGIVEPRQPLIYGLEVSDIISRRFSNVSSLSPNFRPVVCIWIGTEKDNKVSHQRSYWLGGKDNEIVFCIGINNLEEQKIIWSDSFSWSNNPLLEKYILKNSLNPGGKLDFDKLINELKEGYSKNLWRPREFSDYRVLKIPFGDFMVIITAILVIIANIIVSISIFRGKKNK